MSVGHLDFRGNCFAEFFWGGGPQCCQHVFRIGSSERKHQMHFGDFWSLEAPGVAILLGFDFRVIFNAFKTKVQDRTRPRSQDFWQKMENGLNVFFWKASTLVPLFSHISRLQILRKTSFQKEYTVRPPSFPHFTRKLMISKFGSSPLPLGGWIFRWTNHEPSKVYLLTTATNPSSKSSLTTSPHWKDASLGLFPHHAGDPLSCSPPVSSFFSVWNFSKGPKGHELNLAGILVREVYDAVCYCSKPKCSQGRTGRNISDTWTTNIYKWKNSGTSLNKLLILAKNDQNSISPA